MINDGRAENAVHDWGAFLARAETVVGLDPESTIEFKFTVLTLEPNWGVDGISLSSHGSILAGRTLDLSFNDALNLSPSGISATVDDSKASDLIAVVGAAPVVFTSGSTISFNAANHDSVHGFLNGTHTKKWGIDMAGASEFTAIYTAGLVSPAGNIQNEQFVFGVQLTAVPEPPTVIPLAAILLGITLLGHRRKAFPSASLSSHC